MKKKPWNRFEAFAQRLVEGSFHRLFGEQSLAERVSVQLAEAVEAHQVNGRLPDTLSIFVRTNELQAAVSEQGSLAAVEQDFNDAIVNLAQMLQLEVPKGLTVALAEDASLAVGTIRIDSQVHEVQAQSTQVQKRLFSNDADLQAIKSLDAFLIVTGQKHILLDKPLISLGRSLENDVVLDEPTVSRKHAQIRWRFGRFVVYDLSKRGRTVVNGIRVSEHVLEPGDVIALSHLMIIYGEEHTRPHPIKKQKEVDDFTQPMDRLDK